MAKTKALEQSSDKAAPSTQPDLESVTPMSARARISEAREPGAPAPPRAGPAPVGQAAKLLEFPAGSLGGVQRAGMAAGLQRTVGNARLGQMLGEPTAPKAEPEVATDAVSLMPSMSSPDPVGGARGAAAPSPAAEESLDGGTETSPATAGGPVVGLGSTGSLPPDSGGGSGAAGGGDGGGEPPPATGSLGVIQDLAMSTPTAFVDRMASVGSELTLAAQTEEGLAHDGRSQLRAFLPGSVQAPSAPDLQQPKIDATLDSGIVGPEAEPPELGGEAATSATAGNHEVNTDPGPPPAVTLSGSSDPARASAQAASSEETLGQAHTAWSGALDQGPGAEQVQPIATDETYELPVAAVEPIPEAPLPASARDYAGYEVEENVRQQADQILQPSFQEHLATADEQLQSAVEQRDQDRAAAVEDAQDRVTSANAEACQEQDARIQQARSDIQSQQEDVRAEQAQELAKAQGRTRAELAQAEQQIADRRQQDDAEIARQYDDARQQAEAEKHRAEQEAQNKQQEAEDKKKDPSLWSRAVSAVGDFVSKIAAAVTSIFDALAKAVTALLDKVKAVATRIIDAAIKFATGVLDTLGRVLQTLVTTLVGSVFPGLAARLNAFIDRAVASAKAAVVAIGEKLKSAVNAIVDGLGAAIRKTLQVFKTAITTGLQFAAAVVTGDFSGAFRALLEGALRMAGVSPEAFYGFVGKPMDTILGIVRAPGKFLLTLLTAVKTGFGQFASNMLKHLKTGFFAWIVGPIGAMGLSLPKSWDLKGIFSLVLGVLGLNRDGVRKAVVTVLGERAGGGVFDFVLKYFDALMEDGVEGLWEQLKDDLSGLWTMVVDGIKGWLITKIFQQAVIKIASLFNPVSAIVQVVLTAWNLFNFLRENIARIWGVVKAVIGGIAQIVKGAFAPVANIIEQQLAKLVPVAISLLANLLGLGGLTKVVRKKIEAAQEFVFKLLKKLIAKVKGLFKRGKKSADAPDPHSGKQKKDPGLAAEEAEQEFRSGGRANRTRKTASQRAEAAAKDGKGRKQDTDRDNARGDKKQQRLDKAVRAIRPKVTRMLRQGINPRFLKARLLIWKVRYRLSSLAVESDGRIVARVNPYYPIDSTKKIPGKTVGDLIVPVLEKADKEYQAKLLSDPETQKKLEAAATDFSDGKMPAPMVLGEQIALLRSGKLPKTRPAVELSPGAKYTIKDPEKLSTTIVGGMESYPAHLRKLKRSAKRLGLTQAEVFDLLGRSPGDLVKGLARLRAGKAGKGKAKEFGAFAGQLRRLSSLSRSLEGARKVGVAIPIALSHELGRSGEANLGQVVGRSGDLAPMTPIGAASDPRKSKGRKGRKEVHRRIGNVFIKLREVADKRPLLVSVNGYDLKPLVAAVDKWLRLKIMSKSSEEIMSSEARLVLEFRLFLESR